MFVEPEASAAGRVGTVGELLGGPVLPEVVQREEHLLGVKDDDRAAIDLAGEASQGAIRGHRGRETPNSGDSRGTKAASELP
ncbi:hypothetical protein [Nocardioides sp. YIM 152588]|uniref:hypothetical protein n=1 Tax=Nocardioides sp. YIM 152588 TaxID=3158259 RepID=UPI0032E3E034